MARAHYVKNSRKDHTCHTGHVIPAGEGYFWAAPGFRSSKGGKKYACGKHPFRQSQLTTGARSEPLSAIEAFEDGIEGVGSFEALEDLRAELESALDDYVSVRQEALDAWPNGNSQFEDLVYTAEAARDEIAGWSADYTDEDQPDDSEVEEAMAEDPEVTEAAAIEAWLMDRLEEAKSELTDLVTRLEVLDMPDAFAEANRAIGHPKKKKKAPLAARVLAALIVGFVVLGVFFACGTVAGNAQHINDCRKELTRVLNEAGSPRAPTQEEIEACAKR